ncbi:hypothetical protein AGMMS49990_00210 [Endomicrobiia bacterium]|nr:hypothetical protein AGMMS49990_00210 [Endomicrobiia bacterium]
MSLKADLYNDNIWAAHKQIAELFGIDRSGVSKHIGNILKTKKFLKKAMCKKCTLQTPIVL